MQANQELRRYARVCGVPQWRIAEHLGVAELTLYRWMRTEVNPDKARKIRAAIEALTIESEVVCNDGQ